MPQHHPETVTLAGVRFHAGRRRYGKSTSLVLRTSDGRAWRLALALDVTLEGVTYVHDVLLDGVTYKVFVAPADSAVAKALAGEPADAGIGAPVLLETADGKRYSIHRTPALDITRPAEPDSPPGAFSPAMLAEIRRIADARKCSPEVAVNYIFRQGISRILTRDKYEEKRQATKRGKKKKR